METGEELDRTDQFDPQDIKNGLEAEEVKEKAAEASVVTETDTAPEAEAKAEATTEEKAAETSVVAETHTAPEAEVKAEATTEKAPNGKPNKVWGWTRSNFWTLFWAKVAFTTFVLLAIWLGSLVEKTTNAIVAIPSSVWWLGLSIVVIGGLVWLIIWFRRNRKEKSPAERYSENKAKKKIRLGWLVWPAIIVFPLVSGALLEFIKDRRYGEAVPIMSAEAFSNEKWDLPAEIVLPIIAGCESGGRQFDNEGNLIKSSESTAIGKYQIMASLHEERAKKMGYDIRTEEGNEAYAKVLFSESGTQHWEADNRSRACWEPKLMALGGTPRGIDRPEGISTDILTVGREWSETICIPDRMEIEWERMETVDFEAQAQTGKIYRFPRKLLEEHTRVPDLRCVRFRITDKMVETAKIWYRLSPA